MSTEFVWTVRVYWEDTDAGGVVYYANYLKFMERARTEWFRSLGFEQTQLKEQHGVLFVIAHVEANFRRPARYGDLLHVTCRLAESGKVASTYEQRIYRLIPQAMQHGTPIMEGVTNELTRGELLLDSKVRVACVDAVHFRPCAIPQIIFQEF